MKNINYPFEKTTELKYFILHQKESFLRVGVDKESFSQGLISFCHNSLIRQRSDIEEYIQFDPLFKLSFRPLIISPHAPPIVIRMGKAAQAANVGPMAAVAGAVAEAMGEEMSRYCREVIIENGGDIYVQSNQRRIIGIFAGKTRFSYQIGLEIAENETPLGLCTSSGTIGSSISLGRADAVVIKAHTASLADAAATATANRIQTSPDLKPAVEFAGQIAGVTGVLAIKDHLLAGWGDMKIVRI